MVTKHLPLQDAAKFFFLSVHGTGTHRISPHTKHTPSMSHGVGFLLLFNFLGTASLLSRELMKNDGGHL